MANPADYRPETGSIPESSGVYRFRDADGVVVYVGKARNLRSRLNSYFADVTSLHPRTYAMVNTAAAVDWVTVSNEVEALQVEYSWIKEYDPRFNVRYRDDKSYPYLAITMNEEFPRVLVMRGAKKAGIKYFGPYAHAWAIRETVDQLLRVFPMRSCSRGVFQRHQRMQRPCLLGDIGKCAAPCVGRVSPAEHREIAEGFAKFLGGRTESFIKDLERQMTQAAADLDFERAARLRDDLAALRRALARSAVVLPDGTEADVIGLAADDLEVSIQVFHVRDGRVTGQRSFIVERAAENDESELLEQFILQLYGEESFAEGSSITAPTADKKRLVSTRGDSRSPVPRTVLAPNQPTNPDVLADWLSTLRGSHVSIAVPTRGAKRELLDTVSQNAREALAIHKLKRAGDLTTRSQAMQQLQDYLGLSTPPLRMECIDISGHQGTDQAASIVVFEDGIPARSQYRKYAIEDGLDDLRAMDSAVSRRFSRHAPQLTDTQPTDPQLADTRPTPQEDVPQRTRYRTSLLVVDGGQPQVNAAADALARLGVSDVTVCGLAKRLEEVWLPGESEPLILPRRSEGLYLLQRVRDEAHRFAISYHRQRRAKSARESVLDDIAGLGPKKRQALLREFGSIKRVRAASAEEIAEVPGFGPRLAQAVVEKLAATRQNGGVNVTTGEVLED